MIVTISEHDKAVIDALQQRQDHHARCLGIHEALFVRRRDELLSVTDTDVLALGVLVRDHCQGQKFWLDKITQTEEFQKKAGEAALRLSGVDFNSGEFSVNGMTVQQLVAGEWRPLDR